MTQLKDQPVQNPRTLYRYVAWWTCAWVGVGLVNLFGLARTVILEEAKVGIEPFMPLRSLPWIATGFIALGVLGLALLSKVTLTPRKCYFIVFSTAFMIAAFTGLVIYESLTAKRCSWTEIIQTVTP